MDITVANTPVYISVNGEEAMPVRSVIVDVDEETGAKRLILTNMEEQQNEE